MSRLTNHLLRRWGDRAAVRAELELDPTLRRRFDRLPQRLRDRRVTRAERRLRSHPDIGDAARRAEGDAWRKGGFFTR